MRTIYKTMRGRVIDMNKFVSQNEMTVAVGNMNVNARGDKLGPNGIVVQKAEHRENDTPVQRNSRSARAVPVAATLQPATMQETKIVKPTKTAVKEIETTGLDSD